MQAISLLQPWATLAALGLKKNETRSWKTGMQGALAIHASLGKKPSIEELCYSDEHISNALAAHGYTYETLPRGGVIGLVRLEGVARIVSPGSGPDLSTPGSIIDPATLTAQERAFGDYAPGRFAWEMSGARAFELVPCRGQQRLWMLPDIIRDQVYAGMQAVH